MLDAIQTSPKSHAHDANDGGIDLLLSSGLLAFARHAGFLAAIEEHFGRSSVNAIVGTSSGALVGALWAAGHKASWIVEQVENIRPMDFMRFSPWRGRGLFSLEPLISFLRQHVPENIEDLPLPFAAGVCTEGDYSLRTEGPLAETVAASCAIPWLFQRVHLSNVAYYDGGVVDRIGYDAWRLWRRPDLSLTDCPSGIIHWVESSRRGHDVVGAYNGCNVVTTPASGASFFNLGDVRGQAVRAQSLVTECMSNTSVCT